MASLHPKYSVQISHLISGWCMCPNICICPMCLLCACFWKGTFFLKIICIITFVDCRREILAKQSQWNLGRTLVFVAVSKSPCTCQLVYTKEGLMLLVKCSFMHKIFACKKPSFIAQFLCRFHQKGAMSKVTRI
jgi:hypothetical protein